MHGKARFYRTNNKKKLSRTILAIGLAAAMVLPVPAQVQADETEFSEVSVSVSGDSLTIGNDAIERTFSMLDGKLSTEQIVNKRTDTDTIFRPGAGSEEFVISLTKEQREAEPAIDRAGWTAVADSYHNSTGPDDGPASNLIDGDVDSIWHSNYGGGTGDTDYPYNVLFNLGRETTFRAFSYTPRQQGEQTNGNILGYELYASNETEPLEAGSDSWVKIAEGEFQYDGVNPIYVNLQEECTATQLKFVALSAKNGLQFAGGAEFNLHEQEIEIQQDSDRRFAASDLTLAGDPEVTDTTTTINNIEKTGKKVTFRFAPYTYHDVEYTITENIVMYNGDHFMRKYLEISIPETEWETTAIDYIDCEHFIVNDTDAQWTVPTDAGGVVSLDQYKANLGQPIYIQGMFLGSEFPVTDTQIIDGTGVIRYYTGKNFARLQLDNQLTQDGKYVTWQTVAGSARSTENEVIQADFFDYIDTISTPTEFRIQYNSWFDNMMLIDDENIKSSFTEMDKELSAAEVRPLDSYVVDDGWNNYNHTYVLDASRSGTTLNQSGFWEFNSKFPEGFTLSSELVDKFGSNFGVWVGPRGGYNFYGSLADILTENGTGSKAGGSVDVADRTYIKNLQDMLIKWQQDYGVNYWKWDGFADGYQYSTWPAADGVPGYANNHMTGGYQNMYHVTDLWEAWIDLFEAVRQSEMDDHIDDLWISLTCYVNPSPWWLQWANSVWIQCTADQADAGPSSSKMDRQLTYRDACYYDFINNHEFQFPLRNLYNHDPVYGREGTGMNVNTADDQQFQNYLYMMSTRGSAFWELYFSDSLMTEGKYEVTSEFLQWAEENHHILQNAKMFGGSPNTGTTLGGNGGGENQTYGFSAFDGTDGIISLRNPSAETKEITFTFDRTLGVPENAGTLYYHLEHTYNLTDGTPAAGTLIYGDTYTFTLQPDEVRILSIADQSDTQAPQIERIMSDGDREITVRFNEKVTGNSFAVDGAEVDNIEKSADDVTYHITLADRPQSGSLITVTAQDITDLSGNTAGSASASVTYHEDGLVLDAQAEGLEGRQELSDADSLNSANGFTVFVNLQSQSSGVLAAQENGYEIGVDDEGRAYFTLNGVSAVSQTAVNDGELHSIIGVKENNGILKLYVDGGLEASAYQADNRYYMVKAAPTILGNADFAGDITLQVYDLAKGYDEVGGLLDPEDGSQPLDTENMTVTVSGTSEGAKDTVFDGDDTTFWTSEFAENGIQKGSPYMVIDMGETYVIDRVDYTKRYYNGPANQWKCTGNLREYVLETSLDGQNWTEVSAGPTFDDESYNTKGDGGTTRIEFSPVSARYIRISGTASYHWQEANIDKFMTVSEMRIFGERKTAENVALNKNAAARWADGSDAECNPIDRPISMAVDGTNNNTVSNYGEFGADGRDESSYMEVDFGSVYDIESLNLYRYWSDGRTYKNTVIALSKTEDFADPYIVYNSDTENIHGFGPGSDAAYAETAAGHTFTLDELVQARYVRVYMNGTATGGTTNHIVELEVMGYEVESLIDKSGLEALYNQYAELSPKGYTKETWDAFQAAMETAKSVLDNADADADQISAALEGLQAAVDGLRISKTTLEFYLNEAKAHQADGDVDDCVQSIKDLFAEAIAEGDAVMANEHATYEEVMNTTFKLVQAIGALDMKAGDKTDLEMALELAEMIDLDKYVDAGQQAFLDAKAAAEEVMADGDAMQADIDSAWQALTDAIVNLRLKADKSALEDLLNSVAGLDLSQYTEESVQVFRTAYAAANAVMANIALTEDDQHTVDNAVQALAKAKDGLVAKEDGTGGDTQDPDSGSTGDTGNTGDNGNAGDTGNAGNTGNTGNTSGSNNSGTSGSGSANNGGNNGSQAKTAAKTGDAASPAGLLAVLLISGGAVAVLARRKKVR